MSDRNVNVDVSTEILSSCMERVQTLNGEGQVATGVTGVVFGSV